MGIHWANSTPMIRSHPVVHSCRHTRSPRATPLWASRALCGPHVPYITDKPPVDLRNSDHLRSSVCGGWGEGPVQVRQRQLRGVLLCCGDAVR